MTAPIRPRRSLDEIVASVQQPPRERRPLDEIVASAADTGDFTGGAGRSFDGHQTAKNLFREVAQGATGGLADEMAGIMAVPGGREAVTSQIRAEQADFRKAHPIMAGAAQIVGGTVNPLSRVVGPAAKGAGLLARMGRGAAGGALGGAATAAGEADGSLADRASAAVSGGLIGAGVGAAVPAITSGVRRFFKPKTDADKVTEMLDDVAERAKVKRVNASRAAQELDATRTNVTAPDYDAARPQVVKVTKRMRAAMSDPEFVAADQQAARTAAAKGKSYTRLFDKDGVPIAEADVGSLQLLKRTINERMKAAKQGLLSPDDVAKKTSVPSEEFRRGIRDRNRAVTKGIRGQSPEFNRAEQKFAELSGEIDQLSLGTAFDNPKKFPTPQDVSDHISRLQGDERTRFVQGMLAKAERAANRQGDATSTAYMRLFRNPDVRARIRAAIPEESQARFDRLMERRDAASRATGALRRSLIWQTGVGPVLRATTAARDVMGQAGGRKLAQGAMDNEALLAFLTGQQAGEP